MEHDIRMGPVVAIGPVMTRAPVPTAEVVVATELRGPSRTWYSPAAPLVAGALHRRGVPARCGPVLAGSSAHGRPPAPGAVAAVGWGAEGVLEGVPLLAMGLTGPRPADDRQAELDRAVGAAVGEWQRALRPRTVLLAAPRSFCAGVERAITAVERALDRPGRTGPVYVRKQIVHNTHVIAGLRRRGAVFVEELSQVPDGATVVFSAHGVAPSVRAEADRRGLQVIDATCPLVTKVHAEARRFADRGDTVVLIGHRGHEETEGTLGEAPGHTVLVEDAAEVARLSVPDGQRVSWLTQTTLAVEETEETVRALRERFPALTGPRSTDICYATTNRQQAVRAVAARADVVLVLGSANSSNSVHMVEVARRDGTPAHLADSLTDIDLAWLARAGTVAVSAGASAPPALVDELVAALGGLGPVTVTEQATAVEDIAFALPAAVRGTR